MFMNSNHNTFIVNGGCWCPGNRTLTQMRYNGHTPECTNARQGWEANMAHLAHLATIEARKEAIPDR